MTVSPDNPPGNEESGSATLPAEHAAAAQIIRVFAARIGHYRWTMGAFLFRPATLSHIDRQVIGILKSALQRDLIPLIVPRLELARLDGAAKG